MDSYRQVAVFLTAIPAEYGAVCAFIDRLEEVPHTKGTLFECGQFVSDDREPWQVIVVELGEGTENAAVLTERAIAQFAPTHVFFVGVAGGVKDLALGDVVAATKVYGYESGKDEAAFSPRPDLGHATHAMEQRARSVSRNGAWTGRIKPQPPPAALASQVKPIASGNKVVADTRSATCAFIRRQYGDAVAVEMEGIGFFKAVKVNSGIEAIEIRGISDLIGWKAQSDEEGWQPRAANHAAAFAFEMLARMGREKQNSEQTAGAPAESEPDLSGTPIQRGAFDSILADRIRAILNVDRLEAFRTSIAVEAKQKTPDIESDDPADALFHSKLALEDGIACLALAYTKCKEMFEWEDERHLNAVKKAAKQVLGWLVLRAVDSAWLARNLTKLRQGERIVLTLALEKDCAVEVVLARSEERSARFETHPGSRRVMGPESLRFGTEAGIYGHTRDEVLRELWRIAQMDYQPRVIGPKEKRELADKLKARARQKRYHYVAVSLNDPGQPLRKEDWLEVQRELPQLKLVFLQLGAEREALLLDESSLTTQIEAFLEELGEK